jgi:predicted RNA binding protein YcfA (HicA-like mRNA interferase family)
MPKLPVISADKAIRCFERVGYQIVRQRGSQIRLHHKFDKDKKPLTIPRHKILGRGLLRKLIRDAEITIEQLMDLL